MDSWDNNYEKIVFDTADFPSGILQAIIMNERGHPLSERLVFYRNDDDTRLEFSTDKAEYESRSLVKGAVFLTDYSGHPLSGSFSVSVTDDRDVLPDNEQSILATILLGSELRGHITDLDYYIRKENQLETDVLMMTHGWRRYNIPEVIQGKYTQSPDTEAPGLSIQGTVMTTSTNRGKSAAGASVSVFSWQTDYVDQTITDSNGKFAFSGLEFADSLTFVLQTTSAKGRKNLSLRMDPEQFPPNRIRLVSSSRQNPHVGEFIRRRTSQDTLRGIEIEEVNVQAKQIKSPGSFSFYMPKSGNNVLTLEKLEEIQPINLSDALKHIPFITLLDGKIFITSLIGPAVLIIDDMIINNVDDLDAIIDPSNI